MVSPPKVIAHIEMEEIMSGLAFQFDETGNVSCPEHTAMSSWCDHIQKAMVQILDSKVIWNHSPPDSELLDQFDLQIPMFPVTGQFVTVRLTKDLQARDAGIPRFYVDWDNPLWTSATTQFITYVNPGEGRMVIRDALWQKCMVEREIVGYTECKASHHGLNAQKKWEEHQRSTTLGPAEIWSVYETLWCLHCRAFSGSGSDGFDPDLVPDGAKTGVWS